MTLQLSKGGGVLSLVLSMLSWNSRLPLLASLVSPSLLP